MTEACVVRANAGDRAGALGALGAALHAVQDLRAHSNLVDLPVVTRDSVEVAIWDELVPPPGTLRITGYDATSRDPERPAGDAYSHGEFAKDSSSKNAESQRRVGGQSKYAIAEDLALTASISLIERLASQVGASTWRALWWD